MLSWIPGTPLGAVPRHSTALLEDLGRRVGEFDRALATFDHPGDPSRAPLGPRTRGPGDPGLCARDRRRSAPAAARRLDPRHRAPPGSAAAGPAALGRAQRCQRSQRDCRRRGRRVVAPPAGCRDHRLRRHRAQLRRRRSGHRDRVCDPRQAGSARRRGRHRSRVPRRVAAEGTRDRGVVRPGPAAAVHERRAGRAPAPSASGRRVSGDQSGTDRPYLARVDGHPAPARRGCVSRRLRLRPSARFHTPDGLARDARGVRADRRHGSRRPARARSERREPAHRGRSRRQRRSRADAAHPARHERGARGLGDRPLR